MYGRNSELLNLTAYNIFEIWYVRVFKYLDHDEMIGSRICMFKEVDKSNMLFSTVYFVPT